MALVEPPRPATPEETMDADTLEARLWTADILEGAKPRWHSGMEGREEGAAVEPPLGERFERALAEAKRAADGLPPLGEEDEDARYRPL